MRSYGPVRIGFLTPYSGIYPYFSQHLLAGFFLGLDKDPFRQNSIQFIPEYTQSGGTKTTAEALRKLLFFHQADMISGLVSYRSVPEMIPVIDQAEKLALFFDLGEYIPHFNYLGPNIFYASYQLWQGQYALGYWAGKEFSSGGMILSSVYEAGYHLHSAFRRGASSAGSAELLMHIPSPSAGPREVSFDSFFKAVAKEKPPFVHAILSGRTGNDFLLKWKEQGLSGKIPLLVCENMAFEDMLEDVKHLGLEIYTASLWNPASENNRNREFVKKFERTTGQPANIFALLGYETGIAFKDLVPYAEKRDWDSVRKLLRQKVVKGPRGEKNFDPSGGFILPSTDIVKISTSARGIYKTIVGTGRGMSFNAPEFEEIHRECVSGWQNPYLCI